MRITHEIHSTHLQCRLDLGWIATRPSVGRVIYTRRPFHMIQWKHKRLKSTCLIFENGKLICHGSRQCLRGYCRLLQKLGLPIVFSKINLVTKSAVHQLNSEVDYVELVKNVPGMTYEPELFCGALLKRGNVNYTVFKKSSKVLITGVKGEKHVNECVLPTLLELEIALM